MAIFGLSVFGVGIFGDVETNLLANWDVPDGLGIEMLHMLPDFYWSSAFLKNYMNALGWEDDALNRLTYFPNNVDLIQLVGSTNPVIPNFEGLMAAAFIRTCPNIFLQYWENMLSVPTDTTLTDAQRRTNLLRYTQGRLQTTTETTIISWLETLGVTVSSVSESGYNIAINVANPQGSSFTPLQAACDLIMSKIKPAHLGHTYVFEPIWSGLGNASWLDIGNDTWANFKLFPTGHRTIGINANLSVLLNQRRTVKIKAELSGKFNNIRVINANAHLA